MTVGAEEHDTDNLQLYTSRFHGKTQVLHRRPDPQRPEGSSASQQKVYPVIKALIDCHGMSASCGVLPVDSPKLKPTVFRRLLSNRILINRRSFSKLYRCAESHASIPFMTSWLMVTAFFFSRAAKSSHTFAVKDLPNGMLPHIKSRLFRSREPDMLRFL